MTHLITAFYWPHCNLKFLNGANRPQLSIPRPQEIESKLRETLISLVLNSVIVF